MVSHSDYYIVIGIGAMLYVAANMQLLVQI